MRLPKHEELSRRERQILDILCARPQVTAREVLEAMSNPPSYSSVRTLLSRMCVKGVAAFEQDGNRYRYRSTVVRAARNSALDRVVRTFFDDSPFRAVAALLNKKAAEISDDEYDELLSLIEDARDRGR